MREITVGSSWWLNAQWWEPERATVELIDIDHGTGRTVYGVRTARSEGIFPVYADELVDAPDGDVSVPNGLYHHA